MADPSPQPFRLSALSRRRLIGVHPDLVRVIETTASQYICETAALDSASLHPGYQEPERAWLRARSRRRISSSGSSGP